MKSICAGFPHQFRRLFSFRVSFIVLLAGAVSLGMTRPSSTNSAQQSSSAHRALQARQQLRSYHSRMEREKKLTTGALTTTLSAQQKFSIMGTSSTVFFSDDMESGVNGWTVGPHTDSAAWHQTTAAANSPAHSWWAGIESQGNYDAHARVSERLISPPINLAGGVGSISLLFMENYFTERSWDFCMVDVSTDGGTTWSHLRGGYGSSPSGNSYGWRVRTLDLTPYMDQTINISFLFDTGDSLFNAFPGWFIDNVAVFDQSGTIAGTVYYDWNQNGVADPDEPGFYGAALDFAGPVHLQLTTDYDGTFSVKLPNGNYQVSELLKAPWVITSSPSPWNIDLTTPDAVINNVDFGNYHAGSILRGLSFTDVDKDSVRDITDPPLAGEYTELSDSLGDWLDDQYTDSTGAFNFLYFDAGQVHVRQYPGGDFVSTIPGGNPPEYVVTVPPADTLIDGLLFGSYNNPLPPDSGVIQGYVFNDLDHDGTLGEREPMLSQRTVRLSVEGNLYSETTTDSTGKFRFAALPPDTYSVGLGDLYLWHQSYPASTYELRLGEGELRDSLVFGSYELSVGTLRGNVFNDLNRNGQRDTLEPGLTGWTVSAKGPGLWSVDGETDTAGNYILNDVVEGAHAVVVSLPPHWVRSHPVSPYSIVLSPLETRDSLDFGAYALLPGSLSGTVFNDLNGDAVRDSGEPGIQGTEVRLTGDGAAATASDDSGKILFTGLWAGTYQVRLVFNSTWRQTYPQFLLPHSVSLGVEENTTGVDFGLVNDSTFNLEYRTFLAETLALMHDSRGKLGVAEKKKPYASESTFDLVPPVDGVTGLHIEFNQTIVPASLTYTHFPAPVGDASFRAWDFALAGSDSLSDTDHVVIFARGVRGKTLSLKYWWVKGGLAPAPGTIVQRGITGTGRLLLIMPNTMNVLTETFSRLGGFSSLTVGLGGAHSIFESKPTDVWKSLYDKKHGLHIGPPRCLGVFAYNLKPIARLTKTLPPYKGNNVLFAEMLALKVNLAASDAWVTPSSLGYLIFREDSANRFNGLSIYSIARKIDTAMSSFNEVTKLCVYDDAFFNEAYRTIRMIDSAFSGPFDTVSYASVFSMKPARALSEVPYLHLDSSFTATATSMPRFARTPILPEEFSMAQNYPNPFNPATTIAFVLAQPSKVTLKVYNMLGQEVVTLLDRQEFDEGEQEIEFNAGNLASGVYFYRLTTEGIPGEDGATGGQKFTAVKKMMLLK